MSNPAIIKELTINNRSVRLLLQGETPLVECEDQTFSQLWFLVQNFPLLSDPAYIKEFAEISNFFWKGMQFNIIESIPAYQKFYMEQVELEKKCPGDIFPYRLTDYKVFDVLVMHEPRLEEDKMYFFVYNTSTGLPYRVVCPFPYTTTSTFVHYQILPLKTEPSRS